MAKDPEKLPQAEKEKAVEALVAAALIEARKITLEQELINKQNR